jgi:recombination protein RecR
MSSYPRSIEKLIERLVKLPGIGKRSAERIVEYILNATSQEIKMLSEAINRVKESIKLCKICNNLSEQDTCAVCLDNYRQKSIICVVEKPSDVIAIEKTGAFKGLYHVLMGAISPLEGRGPSDIKIDGLIERIKKDTVQEVIVATDADTEGEATALYLSQLIKPLGVKISRIGLGIPFGSNVEYADASTLSKALESRREV